MNLEIKESPKGFVQRSGSLEDCKWYMGCVRVHKVMRNRHLNVEGNSNEGKLHRWKERIELDHVNKGKTFPSFRN